MPVTIGGTTNGSGTRNELVIDFASTDSFLNTDTIDFTLQLSEQSFNGDFYALVVADAVDMPTTSENGDSLDGNGGSVAYVFDAESLGGSAPDPPTLGMVGIGLAGLLFF